MADLNDPARLAELRGAVLRADADAILDACVVRAAKLARSPIAVVSLLVRHVQLLRAQYGLPLELAVSCATSRSNSFCQLVVLDEVPLIVDDALRDERVPKELVESYGIRAYAGVPVRAHGHVLGALCVLDVVPRRFDQRIVGALEQLAIDVSGRLSALTLGDAPLASADVQERLVRVEQATRALERALLALSPVIAAAQAGPRVDAARGIDASPASRATHVTPASLRAAVSCWRDMGPVADELCEEAAAIASASPCEAASGLATEARALARNLAEIGPLVRLAEGVLDGTLGEAAAAKGRALVLRGALDAHEAASAAVQKLRAGALRARAATAGPGSGAAAPPGAA
ncbi:GAF domain-containing protein [Sorangium atrum]|uniref:GAF domain-containing protein n=1 Tax=Sorangium atrum TaxID=2995308 RepID=A0ABT5C0F4_9BACT|nr:GAF domain-containing protein [Sorangium aterium]MDC0679894.1 GAF domain-containing protein [Sorangium aterium]